MQNEPLIHILIVEDETIICQSLARLLTNAGYAVDTCHTFSDAKALLPTRAYDLIISDIRLPDEPGTQLITHANPTPVLIMTSYASIKSAVDALKLGAIDYIAKPFDFDEMLKIVKHALSSRGKAIQPSDPQDNMIGEHPLMQRLQQQISKAAPVDSTVLIVGPSGTGKELVAKALHNRSARAEGPLISVNCAAIPETLIEAELFGHEKGAFTGAQTQRKGLVEAANQGTLFLDEIGELPMEAQARLLRLLQEKEVRPVGSIESRHVDVRIIAATHRPLKQLAQEGQFREDLYYRLHVIELSVPALHQRGNDVLLLAEFFIQQLRKRFQCGPKKLTDAAQKALLLYDWPGNVRELEHAIERAIVLSDDADLDTASLGIQQSTGSTSKEKDRQTQSQPQDLTTENLTTEEAAPSADSLDTYFKRFVLENQDTLNETELAEKLGISRKTLWERRQKLGIPRRKA